MVEKSAFPTTTYHSGAAMNGIGVTFTDDPGMTLRDWFAGQVMVALSTDIPFDMHTAVDRAKWAYMQADAMLAARAPDGVDGKGEG